jgi:hypothetical protein
MPARRTILTAMKRFLPWITLTALAFGLSSCGLPGALGRSAANGFNALKNLVPSASASGTANAR